MALFRFKGNLKPGLNEAGRGGTISTLMVEYYRSKVGNFLGIRASRESLLMMAGASSHSPPHQFPASPSVER